jgi:hypothetical protein
MAALLDIAPAYAIRAATAADAPVLMRLKMALAAICLTERARAHSRYGVTQQHSNGE